MKKKFGNEKNFAIEYELLQNPYAEGGLIGASWGVLDLWVDGKNLCKYSYKNKWSTYTWNLSYIVTWFFDNWELIVGFDPYPLDVEGKNLLELLNESDNYDSDDELEFDLWYGAKNRWLLNHGWFSVRGGEIIPCVYFRRVDENIEISWNNEFWKEEDVLFESIKGVSTLSHLQFRNILFEFLYHITKELKGIVNEEKIIDEWFKKLKLFGCKF